LSTLTTVKTLPINQTIFHSRCVARLVRRASVGNKHSSPFLARNIRYQGLFGRPYAKILAAQLHITRVESSPRRVSHGEPFCLLLRHEPSRIQLPLARAHCEMELHCIPCERGLERKFAGAAISGRKRAGSK